VVFYVACIASDGVVLFLFNRQIYFTRRIGSGLFSQTMPTLATNKTGSMLIVLSFDPFVR